MKMLANNVAGLMPNQCKYIIFKKIHLEEKVLVVEPQGSHQITAIELQKKIVKIQAPPAMTIHPGDSIHLSFTQPRMHFFDRESEKRIAANV